MVDFRLHVYDTTAPLKHGRAHRRESSDGHSTTMEVIKTIQAGPGRWTITDSHLSPDNQRSGHLVLESRKISLLISHHLLLG